MESLVHKNRYFRRQNHCTRLNDRPGKGNFIFSRGVRPFYSPFHSFFATRPLFSTVPTPRPPRRAPSRRPRPRQPLVFLFTAANNSFCDVISLRLCSFADTPVLYSIPRDSYGSSAPCMLATFPTILLSISLRFFCLAPSGRVRAPRPLSVGLSSATAYSLPWHEDRNGLRREIRTIFSPDVGN